ncbi:MAG: helix-turn-helix transcriptional regulator [Armatimonadota bacterium]
MTNIKRNAIITSSERRLEMARVSKDFGNIISNFLKNNNLTYRKVALESGISAAYWKDMSDGRVPSEELITKIANIFDDLDENELLISAGYAPKNDNMDAVRAVEFALRGQKNISDLGKKQILDFVARIQEEYSNGSK